MAWSNTQQLLLTKAGTEVAINSSSQGFHMFYCACYVSSFQKRSVWHMIHERLQCKFIATARWTSWTTEKVQGVEKYSIGWKNRAYKGRTLLGKLRGSYLAPIKIQVGYPGPQFGRKILRFNMLRLYLNLTATQHPSNSTEGQKQMDKWHKIKSERWCSWNRKLP